MKRKAKLEEYTESEFAGLLNELIHGAVGVAKDKEEEYLIDLVFHIVHVAEHPEKSDLIFYPPAGRETGVEGVLREIKEWRAKSGKPGFKESD